MVQRQWKGSSFIPQTRSPGYKWGHPLNEGWRTKSLQTLTAWKPYDIAFITFRDKRFEKFVKIHITTKQRGHEPLIKYPWDAYDGSKSHTVTYSITSVKVTPNTPWQRSRVTGPAYDKPPAHKEEGSPAAAPQGEMEGGMLRIWARQPALLTWAGEPERHREMQRFGIKE